MWQVSYQPPVSGGGNYIKLELQVQKLDLHADEVHDGNGAAFLGHI